MVHSVSDFLFALFFFYILFVLFRNVKVVWGQIICRRRLIWLNSPQLNGVTDIFRYSFFTGRYSSLRVTYCSFRYRYTRMRFKKNWFLLLRGDTTIWTLNRRHRTDWNTTGPFRKNLMHTICTKIETVKLVRRRSRNWYWVEAAIWSEELS